MCVDSRTRRSGYWAGAVNAAAIPTIAITTDPEFRFSEGFPREFQPRLTNVASMPSLEEVLDGEFDLYEQEFLKAEDASAIERYTKMQVEAGALDGHYETNTRRQYMEVIVGGQYNIFGQAGAVGPNAHSQDLTFTQNWGQIENKIDLDRLAAELKQLHQALEREGSEPAQKLATGAVAAAEQSALQKDGPKALEYLKTAGTWALSVAQTIGIDVAEKAIKAALGIPF
jgi:hypothetical protein